MISKLSPQDFGASRLASVLEGAACHYYRTIPPHYSGNGIPFFVNNVTDGVEVVLMHVPIARFLAAANVDMSSLPEMALSDDPLERAAVERILGGPRNLSFIPRVAATGEGGVSSIVEVLRPMAALARALAASGVKTMPVEEMPHGHVPFMQTEVMDKSPVVFALKELGAQSVRSMTPYNHYLIASLIDTFAHDRSFRSLVRGQFFGVNEDITGVTTRSFLPLRLAEAYVWLIDRQFRAFEIRDEFFDKLGASRSDQMRADDLDVSRRLGLRAERLISWSRSIAREKQPTIEFDEIPDWRAREAMDIGEVGFVKDKLRQFIQSEGVDPHIRQAQQLGAGLSSQRRWLDRSPDSDWLKARMHFYAAKPRVPTKGRPREAARSKMLEKRPSLRLVAPAEGYFAGLAPQCPDWVENLAKIVRDSEEYPGLRTNRRLLATLASYAEAGASQDYSKAALAITVREGWKAQGNVVGPNLDMRKKLARNGMTL